MTKEERILVCKAVMDLETGHYLLYPRTKEEMEMVAELDLAISTPTAKRNARQKELFEEYRRCTEPEYKGNGQQ